MCRGDRDPRGRSPGDRSPDAPPRGRRSRRLRGHRRALLPALAPRRRRRGRPDEHRLRRLRDGRRTAHGSVDRRSRRYRRPDPRHPCHRRRPDEPPALPRGGQPDTADTAVRRSGHDRRRRGRPHGHDPGSRPSPGRHRPRRPTVAGAARRDRLGRGGRCGRRRRCAAATPQPDLHRVCPRPPGRRPGGRRRAVTPVGAPAGGGHPGSHPHPRAADRRRRHPARVARRRQGQLDASGALAGRRGHPPRRHPSGSRTQPRAAVRALRPRGGERGPAPTRRGPRGARRRGPRRRALVRARPTPHTRRTDADGPTRGVRPTRRSPSGDHRAPCLRPAHHARRPRGDDGCRTARGTRGGDGEPAHQRRGACPRARA